ncbi:MAG: hypothetical protein QOK07_66 [Gemmatimonadaceae bacterium]|jgi:DNA-binding SARP family transcriptional activator|nr:hypothetical protein [Gemmatimonadaceae bacterium]
MVRLRVLGSTELAEDGARDLDAILAQPKRLAIVVYLALARPRGFHRREVLLSLFWPGSDPATARNSLRQALHFLRHSLGEGVIVSRGEHEVKVDERLLWCDAVALQTTLESRDPEEALSLYRGDLMPGTQISDAPEFNRWLDEERERLRQLVTAALEKKATEAERRGDHSLALQVRQRISALDPLSARAALALMRTLANAGNRAAAVRHAAAFTRKLHVELGVDGDDGVTAFAAELRSDLPAARFEPSPTRTAPVTSSAASTSPGVVRAVVLPFAIHGYPAYDYLGQGMVDLLSRTLDGGALSVVDPYAVIGLTTRAAAGPADPDLGLQVAQRFNAELFVLGSVVGAHGRLQVFATLYHVERGRLVTAEATVADDSALFGIVEDLTRQLLIGRLSPAEGLTRIAATLTPSITALKAYLMGESQYRRGLFGPAREALEQAVAEDPSFALAWYRLGHATFWLHQGNAAVEQVRRAVALSERLRAHDRALMDAFLSSLDGHYRDAERIYREILSAHPDNVEAWLGLAQVLLHFNPFRGRTTLDVIAPLERVLELDPENGPARMFIAYVMAKLGKLDDHRSAVQKWDDKTEFAIYPRTMAALSVGTREEGSAIIDELSQANDTTLNEAVRYVARLTYNLPGAQRIARLMTDSKRPPGTRAYGHVLLAQLAVASGSFNGAVKELKAASAFDPGMALLHRAFVAALPFLDVPRAEIESLCIALGAQEGRYAVQELTGPFTALHDGLYDALGLYVLGHLEARAENYDAASKTSDRLARLEMNASGSALADDWSRGVLAHVAWRQGRKEEALATLEGAQLEVSWAHRLAPSPFLCHDFERYLRAQLLEMVGRDEDSLGWYESATGDFVHEVVFLAPSYLQRAQIFDRRGDYAKAREFYQRFIALWSGADPDQGAGLRAAKQRLMRLGAAAFASLLGNLDVEFSSVLDFINGLCVGYSSCVASWV